MGFVRSHYVGRTFISPNQKLRDLGVKLKLAIVKEVVKDKRIVVVDDSIVRGTTTRGKIRALRDAGAKEIHLRVSCPPIRFPCFYGVDFPTKEELLANNRTLEQIRDSSKSTASAIFRSKECSPVRRCRRITTARPAGAANTGYPSTSREQVRHGTIPTAHV